MNIKKTLLVLMGTILPLSLTACDNSKTSSSNVSANSNTSVVSSSSLKEESSSSSSYETDEIITIARAIELANEAGENGTTEEYIIKGKIKEISSFDYGAMTIEDETGSLYIYGVYDSDRTTKYSELEDKPVVGDLITLEGKLKVYKGTPEMDRGYIIEFEHVDVSENIDLNDYILKTISEARNAEKGTKLQLKGTVAKITYADKMNPNGFYLIDDNASIYVYGQIAQQVSVGNKITIAGEKDYYVLGTEQNSADKFGYKGSCQIANAHLVENDKGIAQLDLDWCQESTVKNIMETPVTENITTNIYKVNAVVNRVEGKGFVNYYFNDLDNETGSYAYSQNSGSDFEYLQEFDGKICTVYLSPLNCKSTDTGCFYRFIPIQVTYDNYQFDLSNTPSFVLEYYVLNQFENSYFADPNKELMSNVDSELLGFEGATITYESNNTDVAYFEEVEGKTYFHTKGTGEAELTITASYSTYESSETLVINTVSLDDIDYVDVKTAAETSDNERVIVRGVVSSSLVNKDGFYIVDDSGLIAVEVQDRTILDKVYVGDEVIVEGIKEHQKKNSTSTNVGQNVVAEATLVANLYGNHEYSTDSFEELSFDELYTLASDVNTDYSTNGYRVTGKIVKVETAYYTNYYLSNSDESNKIQFYSGNGKTQYGYLLEEYVGEEITVELAMCNWNSSKNYVLCAIAIVDGNSKIINTCNWN